MSTEHAKKAAIFNKNREKTTWHDQTFWSVRMKHDDVAHQLPEWEALREHASNIKKHTITLPTILKPLLPTSRVVESSCIGPVMPMNSTP